MSYGRWIIEHLLAEEGYAGVVYLDTKGLPTGGIGHLILPEDGLKVGDAVPDDLVRLWFCQDLCSAESDFSSLFGAGRGRINDARRVALVSMCWQMGRLRVLGFREMRKAIMGGDWALAAREALDSQWAREDTPARAARVARMLDLGVYRGRNRE